MKQGEATALPAGLEVARMSARLGAWLVDTFIFVVLAFVVLAVASAAGAISVNPEAQVQLANSPGTLPTVTPYLANLPLLAVFAAGFIVANVVYATVFVARMRGLPGQLINSLQVGDFETGRNLSLGRSFVRAVVSVGIPSAGAAVFLYLAMALASAVLWSDVVDPQPGGPAELWLSGRSIPMMLALAALFAWPPLLLILTASSPRRRGPHDLAAGSQVVGRVRRPYGYGVAAGGAPWLSFGAAPGMPDATDDAQPATSSADPGPAELPQSRLDTWLDTLLRRPRPAAYGSDSTRVPMWPRPAVDGELPARLPGATVSRRVVAYALDSVIVYTIFGFVQTLLLLSVFKTAISPDTSLPIVDEKTSILLGLMGGIVQIIYFVPSWAILKATLGQRITHISVADATTGKPLGWMDAFLRWAIVQGPFALVTIVPQVAVGFVSFLGMLWLFFLLRATQNNADWRGLHDRFVNSRVALEP
jgi:hypothetical protein